DGSDLLVERAPLRGEPLEHGARVGGLEQRPVAVHARALQLLVDGGLEIDHDAGAREPAARTGVEHRAAARRDDDARMLRELGKAFTLALAEFGLAFLLEDERYIDAGAPLDLGVAVVKPASEDLRELAADRGLARAHRPDQVDVVGGV